MNSRDGSRNATALNLKHSTKKNASKRFLENYCSHQNWSLPDSIMHYVAKNPSTSKCYQKMVQCCKYFFVKNQGCAEIYDGEKYIFLNIADKRFWTSGFFDNFRSNVQDHVSSIVLQIYRCDVERLFINNQIISYQDYCLLSTCAKRIDFYNGTVKNADGSITSFEKLIEVAHNLQHLQITSDTILSNITSNTFQKLVKLPNFSKLEYLRLNRIPETFNLDAFYIYMKTNNFTSFNFCFVNTVSEAFKNRLNAIVDEIIATENHDYKIPYISFAGLGAGKQKKFNKIYNASEKK